MFPIYVSYISEMIAMSIKALAMLILFDLIMKCVFVFYYITIIYALMVLLITMLVATVTILYDLTIQLFT